MARKIEVQIVGDSRSLERSFGRVQAQSTGLSRAFAALGVAVGAGLVGGLVMATKSAVDFDRSMRNVNSIARLSEGRFKGLSKSVLALAKETGQAPKTLADGLYGIVSSGFKASDAIKVLRASAKAATAGMTDTETASRAVAAALNAYHLEATDARKVSDVLFQTVNKGVLTFEELAQNMGDLVPAAAPLGVSLEEVGAAIATITLQGVPAAEAATRVKNTMLSLAKPSAGLSKLLKENGFESGEAAVKATGYAGVLEMLDKATKGSVTRTAALTPEIRALMGVVGLTGKNLDTYNTNLRAMDNASQGAGATARAFAEQGKSIAFQWQKAKASLIAAAIPVGQMLFPALAKGADAVGELAQRIEANMPQIRAQFGELAAGAQEIGGALIDLGSNRQAQAALIGLGTAGLAAKKLIDAKVAIAGMATAAGTAAGPIGLVAVGLGAIAALVFLDATRVGALEQAFLNARTAALGLTAALDAQGQSHLNVRHAQTAVQTSTLALEAAQKNAASAFAQFGRGSLQHRQALNGVRSASDGLAQAKKNLETATKNEATADEQAAQKKAAHRARLAALTATANELRRGFANLEEGQKRVAAAGGVVDTSMRDMDRAMRSDNARAYAKAIGAITRALGGTKSEARDAEKATLALGVALGRLPTQREVNIIVREQRTDARRAKLGATPRAGGGFVPMMAGATRGVDSVLIHAAPGEIILNERQQNMLGGPRFLADLFGFTGNEGPAFATGGKVKKPTPKQIAEAKAKRREARRERVSSRAEARLGRSERRETVFVRGADRRQRVRERTGGTVTPKEIDGQIRDKRRQIGILRSRKRQLLADAARASRQGFPGLARQLREKAQDADSEIRDIQQDILDLRVSKRDKVAEQAALPTELPAELEEELLLAEDTEDPADDIAALRKAEAFWQQQLEKAGTAAERVPIRRELKSVRDQIKELQGGGAAAASPDTEAQLAQAKGNLSASQRALQLQSAAIGAGAFGGPAIILQSLVAPTDEMIRHAAGVVADGLGRQPHRSSSAVVPGV